MMAKVIGVVVAAIVLALVPLVLAAWLWVNGVNQVCADAFNNQSLMSMTFADSFGVCVFLSLLGRAVIPTSTGAKSK